jgi:hypothetical protein
MSDLSPNAQAIVDAARADDPPFGASKSRIKQRVLARAAAAAAIGAAAATTSKTAASLATGSASTAATAGTAASLATGGASTAATAGTAASLATGGASTAAIAGGAKLVVGIALSAIAAGSTATGVVAWQKIAARAPVVQVASHTAVRGDARAPRIAPALAGKPPVSPQPPETPMATGPSPARSLPANGPTLHAAAPKEAPLESLEQELPLLQGAQRALRAGDIEQALALLETHAARFPKGALAEERRAVHAIASCRMNAGGARAEAEGFLRDAASSPLVERVRQACIPQGPGVDGVVR